MLYESRVRKTPEVLAPPIDSGSFDIAIDLDALRLISDWDAALAFLADAHFKARVKQFKYVLETAPSIKLAYDIVQENFDVDHPTILENLLETYGYD